MEYTARFRVNGGPIRAVTFESRALTERGAAKAARNRASQDSLFEGGTYFTAEEVEIVEVRRLR